MGTYYGNSANNYKAAHKEGFLFFKTWKSWSMYGYGGNDTLIGGPKNDAIYGGTGNDSLYGRGGNDRIYGEAGNDKLYGEAGDDLLYGGTGTDTLYGGAGNDRLDGGGVAFNSAEYDVLNGGLGNDTFVLGQSGVNRYRGLGYATIEDFGYVTGNTDKIQIGASVTVSRNYDSSTQKWNSYIYDGASSDLIGIAKNVYLIGSDFVKPAASTVTFT